MKRHVLSWMDDHLDGAALQTIRSFLLDDVRFFELFGIANIEGDLDDIQARVSDLLNGHDERTIDDIVQSGPDVLVDELDLKFIAKNYIHSGAAIGIVKLLPRGTTLSFVVTQGPGRGEKLQISIDDGDRARVRSPLGREAYWEDKAIFLKRQLPFKIMAAIGEQPLDKIIDQTDLVEKNLTVQGACHVGNNATRILTDYQESLSQIQGLHAQDMSLNWEDGEQPKRRYSNE